MLLTLQVAATAFMTGLVWFVQVVHYPLFAGVPAVAFPPYSRAHSSRTTLVVGPPMILEAGIALWLVVSPVAAVPAGLAWTGAGVLAAVWISTALVQVPLHGRLSAGFDPAAHQRLVRSNWFRTAAWSLRLALVSWMLLAAAGAGR